MNVEDFLSELRNVRRSGNTFTARCPAHDDKRNSLSISEGNDGRVLVKCHAGCSTSDVVAACGIAMSDLFSTPPQNDYPARSKAGKRIIAEYDYCDESGELLYQAVRYEPKDFRQRRPAASGDWTWDLKGVRRVLYSLPELLASDVGSTVFITEGEKDCDRLAEIKRLATTNVGGAGKWRDDYNRFLADRHIVILPDNDEPGSNHAEKVAQALQGVAASVKIVALPGLPPKGDVSDWLDAGGTPETLNALIEQTPVWTPITSAMPLFDWTASNKIISAADLLNREFPQPKFAVEGIIQEGVNILAGAPKMGKSWLGLNLAVAVSSGGYVLGSIKVEQGDVLYLALEDGQRRLQGRLRSVLNGSSPSDKLHLATEWPTFDNGGLEKIEMWLQAHKAARLIVIDTLKRVRPKERMINNIYGQDYDALAPLSDLANRHGVSILVLHHTRKAQSDDPLDLVSGSTGLTGAADAILVLQRTRNEADASLFVTGRDVEERELALKWDVLIYAWRLLGNADEFCHSAERKEIIDLLRIHKEGMSPKKVADTLGRDSNATRQLIWKMSQGGGPLRAVKRGRYVLADNIANTSNVEEDIDDFFGYPVTDVTGNQEHQATIQ